MNFKILKDAFNILLDFGPRYFIQRTSDFGKAKIYDWKKNRLYEKKIKEIKEQNVIKNTPSKSSRKNSSLP